ncbi:hypothetical protein BDY21DRAFT_205226 [Lineolata rhizophorae]|uniref:Uncharacterized protein n=1 Tax=Lineolata rhizophorae TaxID=578093 RepID=A0A6A6P3Z8_9PEZI|nr:hypothetical protein BDY21DRAFT_205226 [Lineolata rhizophorae]
MSNAPPSSDRFWLDTLFNPGDSPDSTAGQANGGTSTAVQGALELANLGGRPSLAPSTDDNSVPDSNRFWSGPKDPPSTRPTSRYSTDGEARASTPSLQLPSATDEANSSYNPGGNTSSLDVGINPSSGKSVNTLSSIASSTGQKGYKDHHDRHDRDMIGLGGWSEECGNVGPIPRQIELSDTTSRRSNTFPICESDSPLPTSQGSVRLHGSRSNYNVDRLNLCSERHNSIVPRGDQSSLSASAISGSGAELRVSDNRKCIFLPLELPCLPPR